MSFNRVHYPLPLAFDEHPEPAALQRTIRRLRRELEVFESEQQTNAERDGDGVDIRHLREQVHTLEADKKQIIQETELQLGECERDLQELRDQLQHYQNVC